MSFYTSIAEYYDRIFPLKEAQIGFVSSRLDGARRVLDLGCATGALAVELSQRGFEVEGIDLDPEMVSLARTRASGAGSPARFEVGDMAEFPAGRSCEGIVCLGNTLVHLDESAAARCLTKCAGALGDSGKLVVQILNYDRILDGRVEKLPPIENAGVRFDRRYRFEGDGTLGFETSLLVEGGGEIRSRIELHPIRPKKLGEMLVAAGFSKVDLYGGFDGRPFAPDSYPLIGVASI